MPTRSLIYPWPIDLLLWLALGLLAIVVSRYTNIDLVTSSWFFDPQSHVFPLQNTYLFSSVFHNGTHNLSIGLWFACFFMAWRARASATFHGWVFVIITSAIAVSINAWFKHQSMHSCPWSLTDFGGNADYFRALSALPAMPGPGRCLPSGHAGAGFMWIAMIYATAKWWPTQLRKVCVLVLLFALFCGGIQVARGAHFVTHVMWTAVICGLTSSLCFHVYQYRRALRSALHSMSPLTIMRPAP